MSQPEWIDLKRACEISALSKQQIKYYGRRVGYPEHVKLGKNVLRFERSAFETWHRAIKTGQDQRLSQRAARSSNDAFGTVYLLENSRQHLKIGFTAVSLAERLKTLQTANSEILRCLAQIPGFKRDELALHARFANFNLRNEWFRPTPEIFCHFGVLRPCLAWQGRLCFCFDCERI